MPELQHDCGKTVRFPPGTEGKRGKCPHCGGRVQVPGKTEPEERIELDPPPYWEDYLAYLEDRGPPPRPLIMPSKLMLKEDADEHWEQRSQVVWSRYNCPVCKERIQIQQLVCTKCGLDFRSGIVLGQKMRVNDKGMEYLAGISWVQEARDNPDAVDDDGPDRPLAPRRRKKRRLR